MKPFAAKLPPGGAALIALGQAGARDKLLERLQPHGGDVIHSSLSTEGEEQLLAALGAAGATS